MAYKRSQAESEKYRYFRALLQFQQHFYLFNVDNIINQVTKEEHQSFSKFKL